MAVLLPEKDQPEKAAEEKNEAKIKERGRADLILDLEAYKSEANGKGEWNCNREAKHPNREE
jgi:hypothetical protein